MKDLNKEMEGKKYQIIKDYNGQIIGTSRPNLKGRVYTLDEDGIQCDVDYRGFMVLPEGQRLYCSLDKIEFLED
jgi:hypothetical protein